MGAPLNCYTRAGGGEYLESWVVGEARWCCGEYLESWVVGEARWCGGVMAESTNSFRLFPTSISYVYKVFQHLDMLRMV
jgi:hypothetical protein